MFFRTQKCSNISIVARVQPRLSKGITDLLLLETSAACWPKSLLEMIESNFHTLDNRVQVSFVNEINQTNHSTN